MSESALKTAYENALTLSEQDQAEAAELLQDFVTERRPSLLTDEQKAEVARRLADPDRKLVPHEDVMASVRQLLRK